MDVVTSDVYVCTPGEFILYIPNALKDAKKQYRGSNTDKCPHPGVLCRVQGITRGKVNLAIISCNAHKQDHHNPSFLSCPADIVDCAETGIDTEADIRFDQIDFDQFDSSGSFHSNPLKYPSTFGSSEDQFEGMIKATEKGTIASEESHLLHAVRADPNGAISRFMWARYKYSRCCHYTAVAQEMNCAIVGRRRNDTNNVASTEKVLVVAIDHAIAALDGAACRCNLLDYSNTASPTRSTNLSPVSADSGMCAFAWQALCRNLSIVRMALDLSESCVATYQAQAQAPSLSTRGLLAGCTFQQQRQRVLQLLQVRLSALVRAINLAQVCCPWIKEIVSNTGSIKRCPSSAVQLPLIPKQAREDNCNDTSANAMDVDAPQQMIQVPIRYDYSSMEVMTSEAAGEAAGEAFMQLGDALLSCSEMVEGSSVAGDTAACADFGDAATDFSRGLTEGAGYEGPGAGNHLWLDHALGQLVGLMGYGNKGFVQGAVSCYAIAVAATSGASEQSDGDTGPGEELRIHRGHDLSATVAAHGVGTAGACVVSHRGDFCKLARPSLQAVCIEKYNSAAASLAALNF